MNSEANETFWKHSRYVIVFKVRKIKRKQPLTFHKISDLSIYQLYVKILNQSLPKFYNSVCSAIVTLQLLERYFDSRTRLRPTNSSVGVIFDAQENERRRSELSKDVFGFQIE